MIRVLVVDDSSLIREMVRDILTSDPEIKVVGEASDGIQAVAKAVSLKPDIITMDIEMPLLNGLEAIPKIMAERPIPILVITSLSGVRTAFCAVSKGALDVVEKSDIDSDDGSRLIRKVKMLAGVDVAAHIAKMNRPIESSEQAKSFKRDSALRKSIVAIASSTGGPYALSAILSKLPASFPVPIVVAQHVAAGFTQGMAEWLNTCTQLTVTSANSGEIVAPGRVYLNPSELDMRITSKGVIMLSESSAGQLYHPSCDQLLRSVADAFKEKSIGVILSGMGSDGVAGMKAIKSVGGTTIAQDEQSSVVFGMNGLAVQQGAVQRVLSLSMIPDYLIRLADYRRESY
ncbi:MAG: chemotaxis-specific protein-glutamate methyltransferase CheB [Desulfamplus sp.]|nr:chemotaxis-specific protein-glutamate methyltransferase CheB [Desulfamplus sp.]